MPRWTKIDGKPVAIGGDLRLAGKVIKEATAKEYEVLRRLYPMYFEHEEYSEEE